MKTAIKAIALFWVLLIVFAFGFQYIPDSAVFGESDDPADRSALYNELSYVAGVFDDFHRMVNDYPEDTEPLPAYELKLSSKSANLLEPGKRPAKWAKAQFKGEGFKDSVKVRAAKRIEDGIRVKFPKDHFFNRQRNLIIRPANAQSVAFKYQELIARDLGLFTPGVEFIKLRVDEDGEGTWMVEEQADKYYLEKTRVSSGVAFEHCFSNEDAQCLNVSVDEDNVTGNVINAKLAAFYAASEQGDFSVAEDIFDLPYLARFVLMNAISNNPEFLFDRTEYFYTWTNGRITPVFRPAKGNAGAKYEGRSVSRNIYTPLLQYDRFRQLLTAAAETLATTHTRLAQQFAAADSGYAAALSYSNKNSDISDRESIYRLNQQRDRILTRLQDVDGMVDWLSKFPTDASGAPTPEADPAAYTLQRNTTEAAAAVAERLGAELDGTTLRLSGTINITETTFIPAGLTLEFAPGTRMLIAADQSFVSYSHIWVQGTKAHPAVITAADTLKPFGTFLVVGGSTSDCVINYLEVSHGNEARVNGLYCSGQFGLYHTDVTIRNSKFFAGTADDGLNVKYSQIAIDSCHFFRNYADQVDLDFCEGSVTNCRFDNNSGDSNGDGLDFSGSHVLVSNCTFDRFMDKGISIGEHSYVYIVNNKLTNNTLGMAVKDLSHAYVVDNVFCDNMTCYALYQKKQLFGGSTLHSYTNTYDRNRWKVDTDSLSAVFDKVLVEPEINADFGVQPD